MGKAARRLPPRHGHLPSRLDRRGSRRQRPIPRRRCQAEDETPTPETADSTEKASDDEENTKPDWLSDDIDPFGFTDDLLDSDAVPMVSETELAQLLDEAAEELLETSREDDLSPLPDDILDDATDGVFEAFFEEQAQSDADDTNEQQSEELEANADVAIETAAETAVVVQQAPNALQ